ncbi:hypothetical protein Z043_121135, partial [Scleropages formosus]
RKVIPERFISVSPLRDVRTSAKNKPRLVSGAREGLSWGSRRVGAGVVAVLAHGPRGLSRRHSPSTACPGSARLTESGSDACNDETPVCTPTARDGYERLSLGGQTLPPGFPSPFLFPDGLSSIETLLTNIQVRCPAFSKRVSLASLEELLYECPPQGLLKVAIDNARAQEKQVQLEKTELKMELFRERELRETLEKQLAMEQKNRAIIQKRLKKEKKAKRKLQEALEYESKRREQAEQTLKQTSSAESLRSISDSLTQEIETDRSSGRTDAERTIQGRDLGKAINPALLFATAPGRWLPRPVPKAAGGSRHLGRCAPRSGFAVCD